MNRAPHIKVDATVIANEILSGVGNYTLGIVRGFDELAGEGKLTYSLIAPWRRAKNLKKHGLKNFKAIIKIPVPEKYINGLRYFHIPAPVDLLFGPGTYYFPHFRSWPTWFSKSGIVVHDTAYIAYPDTVLGKNLTYMLRTVPGSVKNAKVIFTPSEFSREEVIKHLKVDPEKVVTATAAVDTKLYYPRSIAEIKKTKAKYDIFYDNYLLMVANIEPRKNYIKLIDAYTSLPRSFTDKYPLVIIGADGWNNEKILERVQKAKENNYRIIHPRQFVPNEDLAALYSGASLYVFTPLYEGFGMSVLESYACGTPAVVSNSSSLPEAGGPEAIYLNPDNAKDIAEKIESTVKLLEKDPSKFNVSIKKHLKHYNNWRKSAEVTAAALTGLPVEHFKK